MSPYEIRFGYWAPRRLLLFSVLRSFKWKRASNDQFKAVPCVYLRRANKHPAGTARFLVVTGHVVITRDVSRYDLSDGKNPSPAERNFNSVSLADREEDDQDEFDCDGSKCVDEWFSRHELGIFENVPSETCDDAYVDKSGIAVLV